MTPAQERLFELYPDSVSLSDFLTWSEWALARVGFRPSNCLPIVSVCRDELMAPVDEGVRRVWGLPFQAGSLAAQLFLGRTGLQAALGHAPGEDGRHRFVVFCLPHIGIDSDGTVGQVQRRGMHRPSAACGALVAVLHSDGARDPKHSVDPDDSLDRDDIEMSLLRQRLRTTLPAGPTTLAQLTEASRVAAAVEAQRLAGLALGAAPLDVACISGVVVHLPDGEDQVASVEASVEIDGVRRQLPH